MKSDIRKISFFLAAFFALALSLVYYLSHLNSHPIIPQRQIAGGIVPHHLFAEYIISDFFTKLSAQNPKTLILVGPNHFEKGDFRVLTSTAEWDAPSGKISPDAPVISSLVSDNLAKIDEETLANDPALTALMPFVKDFLPQAKIIPLLISGYLDQDQSEILAAKLSSLMTKESVMVASVDFSHYLTSPKATEKDQITLDVINTFNYHQLYKLNNDYLDSPPSIGTLLMTMQKLNAVKADLLHHTNSGEMQNNPKAPTTSYFSILYYYDPL